MNTSVWNKHVCADDFSAGFPAFPESKAKRPKQKIRELNPKAVQISGPCKLTDTRKEFFSE